MSDGIQTVQRSQATNIADLKTLATTGAGIKVTGAVTTSGTVTEANSGSIKTAAEALAALISAGKFLVTETSGADILAALNLMKPVAFADCSDDVDGSDDQIQLSSPGAKGTAINRNYGITIYVSEDTYVAFHTTTGQATSANKILLAGEHKFDFIVADYVVYKQVSTAGKIWIVGGAA